MCGDLALTKDILNECPRIDYYDHMRNHCLDRDDDSEICFRIDCLFFMVFSLGCAFISPFIQIHQAKIQEANLCDTIISIILAPPILTFIALRLLLGAIIHPSLAFKNIQPINVIKEKRIKEMQEDGTWHLHKIVRQLG